MGTLLSKQPDIRYVLLHDSSVYCTIYIYVYLRWLPPTNLYHSPRNHQILVYLSVCTCSSLSLLFSILLAFWALFDRCICLFNIELIISRIPEWMVIYVDPSFPREIYFSILVMPSYTLSDLQTCCCFREHRLCYQKLWRRQGDKGIFKYNACAS